MKGLLLLMLPMAVAIFTAFYLFEKDANKPDSFDERDIYK
jgi:hypothetical protein